MWGKAWYGEDAALDAWWPVALEVWRASVAARDGLAGAALAAREHRPG